MINKQEEEQYSEENENDKVKPMTTKIKLAEFETPNGDKIYVELDGLSKEDRKLLSGCFLEYKDGNMSANPKGNKKNKNK